MASNHTQNFGLNQWAADDQVLREDFNRDNSILEEALTRLNFVTGVYTGTGLTAGIEQRIELGFTPALLIAFAHRNTGGPDPCVVTQENPKAMYSSNAVVELNGTGFIVRGQMNRKPNDSGGTEANPYRYIAWRR